MRKEDEIFVLVHIWACNKTKAGKLIKLLPALLTIIE